MPPVPSQRPSPGQVPPVLCGDVVEETAGDVLDALAFGEAEEFVVPLVEAALGEGVAPEGADGAFEGAIGAELDVGGGVRPRLVGRGICRVF